MFRRGRLDAGVTDTLIGEGSSFEGKIRSKASIRVEGEVKGDIECEGDVTIGERGKVQSNITARNITIAGTVHGNMHARQLLTLTATAKLYGHAESKSLIIAEGAIFQGTSKMASGEAAKPPQPSPAPADEPAAQRGMKPQKQISAL